MTAKKRGRPSYSAFRLMYPVQTFCLFGFLQYTTKMAICLSSLLVFFFSLCSGGKLTYMSYRRGRGWSQIQ
jgi:hypothetical protein